MSPRSILLVNCTYLVLALLLLFAVAARAEAGDWDHDWSWTRDTYHAKPQPARGRRYARTPRREYDRDEIRGYRSPQQEYFCADKVRGLGTQWIGTDGAMDAAKKDWMERVRYDMWESFLDLSHAKDFISRCGRVSVGETLGQVLYRCEIVARPCRGIFQEGAAVEGKK